MDSDSILLIISYFRLYRIVYNKERPESMYSNKSIKSVIDNRRSSAPTLQLSFSQSTKREEPKKAYKPKSYRAIAQNLIQKKWSKHS